MWKKKDFDWVQGTLMLLVNYIQLLNSKFHLKINNGLKYFNINLRHKRARRITKFILTDKRNSIFFYFHQAKKSDFHIEIITWEWLF